MQPSGSVSLGHYLRAKREDQGMTLDGIAATTKIQVRFLRAIEDDAYELLPSGPYAVGFLKAYAQSVALDPDRVLAAYQEHVRCRESTTGQVGLDAPELYRARPLQLRWVILGLLLVLGLGAYASRNMPFVSRLISPGSSVSDTRSEVATPPGAIAVPSRASVSPVPQRIPKVAVSSVPDSRVPNLVSPPALPRGGDQEPVSEFTDRPPPVAVSTLKASSLLVLRVMAIEKTWLSVDIDGSTHHEVLLQPGEHQRWSAQTEFVLTIGNARGTQVWLNDQEIGLPEDGRNVLRDLALTRELLNLN